MAPTEATVNPASKSQESGQMKRQTDKQSNSLEKTKSLEKEREKQTNKIENKKRKQTGD